MPVLLFAAMVVAPPVNHDVAGILAFAERWLDGERLYADLIDVNPPMVFVLNLLPAWLARAAGLEAVAVLKALLVAMVLALWWLAWRVRDRAGEGPVERAVLDVLPGLVGFGSGYDFGQRETMMAALALPYLLAASRRAEGARPRLGMAAALAAALGFALKPHFLLIPLPVEALVLAAAWRRQGAGALRDSVPWAMTALWLAYAASLKLLFPDYLGRVVPMARDHYLAYGGHTAWDLLLMPRPGTATMLVAVLAVLAFRQRAALPRVLALAALGALASALLQHKGWSYHVMPITLFGCALGVVLGARALDRLRARPAAAVAALAALFGLYLVSAGEAPWNQASWRESDAYRLAGILRAQAGGGRVLALTAGVAPSYPLASYAGVRMTLRTMSIWMLEGAYRTCPADGRQYRAPAEMGAAEAFMYRSVTGDFARTPPAAVVVDAYTGIADCGGRAFDLVAYFARDAGFAAAWARYAPVARLGRFTVYARRD